MLEAVKVLRTKGQTLEIRGEVPDELMSFLESHYGNSLKILDDDNELISPKDSAWYKETEKAMTPGTYLRIYRENAKMTQAQLAEHIGVTRFRVSDMERGVRSISKESAKKLAEIFDVPVDRFI